MTYETFPDGEKAIPLEEPAGPSLPVAPAKPRHWVNSWLGGWRGLAVGLGLGAAMTMGVTQLMSQRSTPPAEPVVQENPASQTVTVAPVTMARVARTLGATGTVAAYDLLPILPQAQGLQIRQVLVDEGDRVQAGQLMAVLDDSVLQAQLQQAREQLRATQATVEQRQAAFRQAQATFNEAQRNLQRYQQLAQEGAISQQELDARRTTTQTAQASLGVAEATISSAEADVSSQVARIAQLETQLVQTRVIAPASGIVAERMARVGDVTSGSGKLFSIIRNGFLELQVNVPETQLPQVRPGASVKITSDADARVRVQGKVREIAPLVDSQTRQARVEIDLPANSLLRPGMFLRAAITSQFVSAMTVPASAVLSRPDGQSIVFVLQDGDRVSARVVEVGARQNEGNNETATIEIRQGLRPGEQVVVAGAGYLKEGDRVRIAPTN